MDIVRDSARLGRYLEGSGIRDCFSSDPPFQLLHFSPGELVTTAFSRPDYLFFVVEGRLSLYDMPDEETIIFLETDFRDVTMIGEIEVFDPEYESFFVEAVTDVFAIAIPLEQYRETLLNDPKFLLHICRSLEAKLSAAVSSSFHGTLREKMDRRIRMHSSGEHIRNVSALAMKFGVSRRQVLRVLRSLCDEGVLRREGHGDYVILRTQ